MWYEVRYLAVDFPKELASHMSIAEALEKQGIRIAELESEISASGASKIHSSRCKFPWEPGITIGVCKFYRHRQ